MNWYETVNNVLKEESKMQKSVNNALVSVFFKKR